jgi:urease accessory protein UreF
MKKLLLATVGLLLAGLFLAHWHTARQVENRLERVAAQLAPIGRLTWENVRLSPSGAVQVNQLRFNPHESRDALSIEQVAFNSGSLLSLLSINRELEANRLPPALGLNLRGLKLPINRELSAMLTGVSPGLPFASAGCRGFETFTLEDLTHLDYWELVIDLDLDYRLVNQGEHLELNYRMRTRQLSEMVARIRLDLGSDTRELEAIFAALRSSRLLMASQDYTDLGFYPRMLAFCAERNGMEPADYIPVHVGAWTAQWQEIGLKPGPLVQAGYQHFLANPQSITVSAKPEHGITLRSLEQTPGLELLARLDAEFSINDGVPVNLAFSTVERSVSATTPASNAQTEAEAATSTEQAAPDGIVLGLIPNWQDIDLNAATRHIGDRAIVHTRSGDRFSGRIVAVVDGELHLSMQTRQGQFVRPVAIDRIERLQVRP